ncbi:MAG: DNA polymerase III subunit delta [Aestuariivirgaceae bacterium]
MGVLKATEVARFVSRPDPAIKAILIYGPDTGAVNENARKLVQGIAGSLDDPFNVIRLSDQILGDDVDRLADEAQAISMMGGRRAVWISGAGNGFLSSISNYLGNADTDSLIVAEAGELPKSSKLRSLFEKSLNALAIPCYLDTRESLHQVVSSGLADHDLKIAPDALHRLCEILGSDRLVTRSELEKLVSYCAGQDTISLEDVNSVCGDTSQLSIDDMIDAIFVGDAAQACGHFTRLIDSGTTATRLLSVAALHIAKLQGLSADVQGGTNASATVKSARPPIFFRRQPAMIRQLSVWRLAALEGAEQTLQSAIAQTRQFPALEPEIAERALLSLARNAQASRINNS